jgi:hypothetical protein
MDIEDTPFEPEPVAKPKRKRVRAAKPPIEVVVVSAKKEKKPKKEKRKSNAPPNKWIVHYMKWREANPEVVANTKNIGELVKLARASYTPVEKGFVCQHCKGHNSPPYTRPSAAP